jgi:hypothetical protein
MLLEAGLELGRPLADRVRHSRLSNLKELRPGSAGRSEIRILYRQAIPLAEQRYEDYMKQEDIR